jgi:hypothetical protein
LLETQHHPINSNEKAQNRNLPILNQGSPTSELKVAQVIPDGGHIEGSEPRGMEALEFRSDARVWYLYLEDAEHEAKEKVERWKAGLDSILIFVSMVLVCFFDRCLTALQAGLFAGIVLSFIIDARRDLPKNLEQNLLSDIRNMVPGASIDMAHNQVSWNWIHALPLTSLYITLFNVFMGVLAKTWLVKFAPCTTRREAADAYQWYRRNKQAESWCLETVVTLVPLLVQQITIFLFLAGLIVQNITDGQTFGHGLLAFCIAGCTIYLTVTILPLFAPYSPFNTPLSDLLLCLGSLPSKRFRLAKSGLQVKTDINEALAEILYDKVICSPNPTYVDEAATEIALPSFKKKCIDYLCQNDAPQHLLTRFRLCWSTSTDDLVKRNETLRIYLLAFLKFVDHLEEIAASLPKDASTAGTLSKYNHLLNALRTSLEPGYPLHRWNNLPDSLQSLSLRLKMQILSTLTPVPKDHWESKEFMLPELDLHPSEMSDRSWGLAFQAIHPNNRLPFMLATCRGVVLGERIVKTSSALFLGLSLAKGKLILPFGTGSAINTAAAGWTATETRRTSEWEEKIAKEERDDINGTMLEILSELYTATSTSPFPIILAKTSS